MEHYIAFTVLNSSVFQGVSCLPACLPMVFPNRVSYTILKKKKSTVVISCLFVI